VVPNHRLAAHRATPLGLWWSLHCHSISCRHQLRDHLSRCRQLMCQRLMLLVGAHDGLSHEVHLCCHLMLRRLLRLHLREDQIHALRNLLPPLLRRRIRLRHHIQDKLCLLSGLHLGFGPRHRGDHTSNSTNRGRIYRKRCVMNNFALHHLNQPPNGILRPNQRNNGSGAMTYPRIKRL
jgi:hypothetical protein